jgi:hypothetical protein
VAFYICVIAHTCTSRLLCRAVVPQPSRLHGFIREAFTTIDDSSPANLYPSTGSPTSLLSLRNGEPAALGLLLNPYLAKTPKILFCPACDQPQDADLELSRVGATQAQSSYYYRHGGNTQLFDNPRAPHTPQLKLANLGNNRNGVPIRGLVIDTMFLCPPELDSFNVKPRTITGKNS